MSETATGVKWAEMPYNKGLLYAGNGFAVRIYGENWWAQVDDRLIEDNYAPDHATAKQQAERWILEREGRLPTPAPATDGGWIACAQRLPENDDDVEVIAKGWFSNGEWHSYPGSKISHWRPLPVDPHTDAACLFNDRYRPTVEQARAAAQHVAECAECRAKLEEKGGA